MRVHLWFKGSRKLKITKRTHFGILDFARKQRGFHAFRTKPEPKTNPFQQPFYSITQPIFGIWNLELGISLVLGAWCAWSFYRPFKKQQRGQFPTGSFLCGV